MESTKPPTFPKWALGGNSNFGGTSDFFLAEVSRHSAKRDSCCLLAPDNSTTGSCWDHQAFGITYMLYKLHFLATPCHPSRQ